MVVLTELIFTFVLWLVAALVIGFFLIFMGVTGYFGWRLWRYNIEAHIYEKTNNGFIKHKTFAREVIREKSEGKTKTALQFLKGFKNQKKIGLPPSATYIPSGMRKTVNLYYKDGIFVPMPITVNSPASMSFSENDLLRVLSSWDSDHDENLSTHREKAGFWDKYGSQMMWGIMIVSNFILWLILIMQLQGGGGGGGQLIV